MDFMGPKKHGKITSSLEVSSCEHQHFVGFVESMISDIFPRNPTTWGIEKFWDLKKKTEFFFGKSKSHHVPWPEDGSSMVNQFFRSSDQRMGLLNQQQRSKWSKVPDQRSWSLCGYFRSSSCWVLNQLNQLNPFILVFPIWGRVTPCNTP